MTKQQIDKLVATERFPEGACKPELVETHISWVLLCDNFVYKIKKPIRYSFLDFSTLEKREHYCEREIELNKRLTDDIYLDVQPVTETSGRFFIGEANGKVVDYAVRMRKLDRNKQMDVLLLNNKVTPEDIQSLAEKIAAFHKNTTIIYQRDYLDIREKFIDLGAEKNYIVENVSEESGIVIDQAIELSNAFMESNKTLLANRLKTGFFRDCHGDLHARNIFLTPSPQPFDCIEFNDDFRQIDVLNEVAFLCMDLDAFGRQDLADLFINRYNKLFPSMQTANERKLFIYYKSYRANVRAKVNSLRAKSAKNENEKMLSLKEVDKYLQLMDIYMQELENKQ